MDDTGRVDDDRQFVERARALGCALEQDAATRLLAYLDAMLDENTRVNLTAVRDRDAAIVRHALDSIALGTVVVDPTRSLDLGTGNGFPGVAIACLHPSAHVTLLDRTQKKVRAIQRCLDRSGFDAERVQAKALDAAQLPAHDGSGAFSLITARAVAAPDALAKLATPLLSKAGRLALWLAEGTPAPDRLLDLGLVSRVDYELPQPAARQRAIAVYASR